MSPVTCEDRPLRCVLADSSTSSKTWGDALRRALRSLMGCGASLQSQLSAPELTTVGVANLGDSSTLRSRRAPCRRGQSVSFKADTLKAEQRPSSYRLLRRSSSASFKAPRTLIRSISWQGPQFFYFAKSDGACGVNRLSPLDMHSATSSARTSLADDVCGSAEDESSFAAKSGGAETPTPGGSFSKKRPVRRRSSGSLADLGVISQHYPLYGFAPPNLNRVRGVMCESAGHGDALSPAAPFPRTQDARGRFPEVRQATAA